MHAEHIPDRREQTDHPGVDENGHSENKRIHFATELFPILYILRSGKGGRRRFAAPKSSYRKFSGAQSIYGNKI
jgi:hypothetical protein